MVHAFPEVIKPIAQLEFELAYYDSAVQHVHHYTTKVANTVLFDCVGVYTNSQNALYFLTNGISIPEKEKKIFKTISIELWVNSTHVVEIWDHLNENLSSY